MNNNDEDTEAPFPEESGYRATSGFVKNNPKNNAYYIEQWAGDLWYPILVLTNAELEKAVPGYNIAQIKSKFGGLRYYIDFPDGYQGTDRDVRDGAYKIIRAAEAWAWAMSGEEN